MGPRIAVSNVQFLEIARESEEPVIRGPKVWLQGMLYLIRHGDYYYYTHSKEPLDLGSGRMIVEAKNVLL